jgi:cytochrome c-type biogenesis protein CcmE
MAGDVVPGSVSDTPDGVSFQLTDGHTTASVVHRGDPPSLFDDGVPVVVEGKWEDGTFHSDRILIRHDNSYNPADHGYVPSDAVTSTTATSGG